MPKRNRLLKRVKELRACNDCAESGGLWLNGHVGARCHCLKGRLLFKLDEIRKKRANREFEPGA